MKFLFKCKDNSIKDIYMHHQTFHNGDSGIDLYIIKDDIIGPNDTKLIDLGIHCQLQSSPWHCPWINKYHSYMIFPRSSISKTPLRLANSVELCAAGYTGELKIALHNTSSQYFKLKKGDSYVQLVAPNLQKISLEIVNQLRNTSRGSTNNNII